MNDQCVVGECPEDGFRGGPALFGRRVLGNVLAIDALDDYRWTKTGAMFPGEDNYYTAFVTTED